VSAGVEVMQMIKLPFSLKSKEDPNERPSVAFAAYCDRELERMRDAGEELDEARFRAAMDLALRRLRSAEGEEVT
jgi:hypothetical protein